MARIKKPTPHAFVLEALERLAPETRSMFGCTAVYLGERIILVLRDREDFPRDNGVWIATETSAHASLRDELPSMRSISFLGREPTNWQNLPAESETFEEEAMRACDLVLRNDPRIGRVPARARRKTTRPRRPRKTKPGDRPSKPAK